MSMSIAGIRLLIALILAMIFVPPVFAEEERIYELDTSIVVTATRTPSTLADLARSVVVIGRSEIDAAPVSSVEELLAGVLSVDARKRGAPGVQSDISIRGGTFEQTLLLIDGIKVTDPQTGHHNIDLPVTLADIERIEILKGPGSRLYGPNAMGGVINIITRQAGEKLTHLETSVGSYGLFERMVTLSHPVGLMTNRVTLARSNSTGYRNNTEFDITRLSYAAGFRTGAGLVNLSARYLDKEFGANQFYSDLFPDEWEATETLMLSAVGDLESGPVLMEPKIFWRRHKDDFVLDRNRPDWYRNRHTTDQYGVEFQATIPSSWGTTVVGGELAAEEMKSSSLGDHSRTRGGALFEICLSPIPRLLLVGGAMAYCYTDWGWDVWPGIDLGYQLATGTRLFFSAGRSFRVPTFTDLYYQSPANLGNPDLRLERSWTYEIGARCRKNGFSTNVSGFIRRGTDLIDWARQAPTDPWQVLNVSDVTTRGVEVETSLQLDRVLGHSPISRVAVSYTFLDSRRSDGDFESKYMLDHPEHQVVVNLNQNWTGAVRQSWAIRYLKRLQGDEYFLVDTRLSWKLRKIELFAEATNIFNIPYTELGTIPMPGRWLRAGLRFDTVAI
ncbi:MAG: TonB-dependent receptor [candidate division Zixibacteria bacterium]